MTSIRKKSLGVFLGFLIVLFSASSGWSASKSAFTLQNIMTSIEAAKNGSSAVASSNLDINKSNPISSPKVIFEVTGNVIIPTEIIKNAALFKEDEDLNPYKIDRVLKNLGAMGIFDSVESRVETMLGGKKLMITVKENPLVKDIVFKGNTVVSANTLLASLQSRKNEIVNVNLLRKDMVSIESIYKEKGYKWAKIGKVNTPKEGPERGLVIFVIEEGLLGEVIVSGNTKTQANVILREMSLKSGQVLEEQTLKEDLRRIYNLNYFSELIPDLEKIDENTYSLILGIKEKPSGSVNFGGGFGESSGLFGFIDLYLDNLFGTGRLVALRGQIGQKNSTYEFKYLDPWMFGSHKSMTYRLWKKSGLTSNLIGSSELIYDARDEDRAGTSISIGWPFTYDLRSSHTFKYESVVPSASSTTSPYKIISYMVDLSYDTRDVWMNPTQGDYYYGSIEKGFKLFSSATDFIKYDISLKKFIKTFDRQTIGMRLDAGYMTGEIQDKSSYIVGGGSTVRGYSDSTPFASGNKRVIASIEYRFLINDILTALLFVDTGFATSGSDILNLNKYKVGKGVGIRVNTPLGPFRLDFGIGDTGSSQFHFNMGHVF